MLDKDSCQNTLKVWNGVNTINGVFSGEYQLSDLPNLGDWKITATVGDQVCSQFSNNYIRFFAQCNLYLHWSKSGKNRYNRSCRICASKV